MKEERHGLASAAETVPITASSALLDARIWFELSPWRISAGWSLLAAALAARGGDVIISLQVLVLLFLLVDPLWGSMWGGLSTPNALPQIRQTILRYQLWLPYLTPGSPAARLFGLQGPGVLSILFRSVTPSVLVAFVVAFVIGMPAVWATLVVVCLSVGSWLHRQVPLVPVPVLHSLVAVAVPWILALMIFGIDPWNGPHWLLALLWTVHVWGSNRHLELSDERMGLVGMALAQCGMILLLLAGRVPLALAILGVLWLASWLAIYQGHHQLAEPSQAKTRREQQHSLAIAQPWWTAALLVSAAALSQTTF